MPPAAASKQRRWQVVIAMLAWASLPLALVAWLILLQADSHWTGTLLAFGPRWVLLVPIAAAAMAAFRVQGSGFSLGIGKRSVPTTLLPLGLAGLVIAWPVMGFCVPWRRLTPKFQVPSSKLQVGTEVIGQRSEVRVKVLTCNTQGARAEAGLKTLMEKEQPDVFVLQEWPSEKLLPAELAAGRHVARAGGILVASRWPIVASEPLPSPASRWHFIGLRCEIMTAAGAVQLFGLHLLTPREGIQAVLDDRLDGLDDLAEVTAQREADGLAVERWMDEHSRQGIGDREQGTGDTMPTMVAGDFNMPVESVIYRRRFGHFQNAFSTAGWGYGGTKFTRYHSVRIDHLLADENFRVERCEVGPDVDSDHRPVVAEVVILVR